jgi:hypothetical protein
MDEVDVCLDLLADDLLEHPDPRVRLFARGVLQMLSELEAIDDEVESEMMRVTH